MKKNALAILKFKEIIRQKKLVEKALAKKDKAREKIIKDLKKIVTTKTSFPKIKSKYGQMKVRIQPSERNNIFLGT